MATAPLRVLGLIPARGGSKSVPRKNIKLLAGRPLIAYTIEAALKSHHVNRLILSTEDREIAEVGRQLGAEVPFTRPEELALDHATDLPVFQHCLTWLRDREGYVPDIVVHLRPTAPLRTAEHIDAAVELLLAPPEADCVRSVCPAAQHPLKMWRTEGPWLVPFVPESVYNLSEAYNEPRQKLPRALVQNGAIDVIRTAVITRQHSMSGAKIKAFVMEEAESVNIDSPLDWELAERLLRGAADSSRRASSR